MQNIRANKIMPGEIKRDNFFFNEKIYAWYLKSSLWHTISQYNNQIINHGIIQTLKLELFK